MASVVVVGGGLAGLVCGTRLLRAGHEVELIEAQSGVGGRLRPVETEHGLLERAVGEVGWGDPNLRALAAGVGLERTGVEQPTRAHALVLGGRLHRPPPLRPRELLWPGLSPRMDRPIDAVFRRPPRWSDRKLLLRALWGAYRQSGTRVPGSVRALDDIPWSRASIRAFGTRWVHDPDGAAPARPDGRRSRGGIGGGGRSDPVSAAGRSRALGADRGRPLAARRGAGGAPAAAARVSGGEPRDDRRGGASALSLRLARGRRARGRGRPCRATE